MDNTFASAMSWVVLEPKNNIAIAKSLKNTESTAQKNCNSQVFQNYQFLYFKIGNTFFLLSLIAFCTNFKKYI